MVLFHGQPVTCVECGAAFTEPLAHYNHTHKPCGLALRRLSSKGPDNQAGQVCEMCGTFFLTKSSLLKHLNSVHRGRDKLECGNCGKTFKRFGHFHHHQGKPCRTRYKCEYCTRRCKSMRQYLIHLRGYHLKELACPVCEDVFCSASRYQLHLEARHTLSGTEYECDFPGCDYRTLIYGNLKAHIFRHLRLYSYTCDTCNKGYYDREKYKGHVASHSGNQPYQCHVCGKAYGIRGSYQKHIKKAHPEAFPWGSRCPHCGVVIIDKVKFQRHVDNHQTRKFICDFCGKCVSSATVLADHRRIHTGELPFQCTLCLRRFSSKKYLTSHNRIHTKERPHTCRFCLRKFSQRSALVGHQKACSMREEVVAYEVPEWTAGS